MVAVMGKPMPLCSAPACARLVLILATLGLAACTGDPAKVEDNVFPTEYKKMILTIVTNNQSPDPTNIREAAISEPVLRPVEKATRYVLCVRYNPRNEKREYSGITERIVYFYQGHVTQFVPASREQCSWADYKPFPELEKICMGEKCA
jgi:hypothetical protein